MRAVSPEQLPAFLERFDNFKNAELESIEIITPLQIKLTMTLQDKARAFDWIKTSFEFNGIKDAHIPQENHLSFIEMSEGASLFFTEGLFTFATSLCYNISDAKNSSLYFIAKSLKYEESAF
jgi:hypothetical protein